MREKGYSYLENYQRSKYNPRADVELEENLLQFANSGPYVEVHIYGGLNLSDIAIFEFGEIPPTRAEYEILRKHGIEVRDARTRPAKPWLPTF